MKISRKSQAYRIINRYSSIYNHASDADTLCQFVRMFLFALVRCFALFFFIGWCILSFVFQVISVVLLHQVVVANRMQTVFDLLVFLTSFFITCLSLGFLLAYSMDFIRGYLSRRKYMKRQKHASEIEIPKEPSIILEYLKAKKQKICPFVTFKD